MPFPGIQGIVLCTEQVDLHSLASFSSQPSDWPPLSITSSFSLLGKLSLQKLFFFSDMKCVNLEIKQDQNAIFP